MIILLVIVICFILYKAGIINRFLAALKTGPDTAPEPNPEPYQEPPETREKWENEARYILTIQGKTNPDTVKYMGDEMLKRIVRDYLDI